MLKEPEKRLAESVLSFLLLSKTDAATIPDRMKELLQQATAIAEGANVEEMVKYGVNLILQSHEEQRGLSLDYALTFTKNWLEGVLLKVTFKGLSLAEKEGGTEGTGKKALQV